MPTRPVPERFLRALIEVSGRRHDRELDALVSALYLQPDERDAEHTQMLAEQCDLEAKMLNRIAHPFLPTPPPQELPKAGTLAGTIPHYPAESVFLPLHGSKSGHIYTCGATSSGKTTLAKLIVVGSRAAGHRIVISDPEGQFATDILRAFPPHDVYVCDAESYQVNVMEHPALKPREWLGWMENIFAEIFYFRKNTENFTNNAAIRMLESGRPLNLRSLLDEVLRKEPQKYTVEYDAWQRVKSTFESLLFYLPTLGVQASRGLAEIFSRPVVVFDWSRLRDTRHKRFLTLHTLSYFLAARTDDYGEPADALWVFDEVHEQASREIINTADMAEPAFEHALRTAAKRRVHILTIDQNPGLTHPVVRGNSAIKIVMRLEEGRDKRVIAEDLDLTPEQRAWLSRLERQAIVKLPTLDPFLIDVPEIRHAHRIARDSNSR